MKNKYKLIKKYPGSPELGYITNFNSNDEDWNTPNMLILDDCKNYPEFWEKVVEEKDYEILELICKDEKSGHYNKILEPKRNGLWQWRHNNVLGNCTLESLLECGNSYYIHKVLRKFDGEVFTVGDRVKYNRGKCNYDYFIIDNFCINRANMMLLYDKCNSRYELLGEVDKLPEPLFTTEDGVEIFEGDTIYTIYPSTFTYGLSIVKEDASDKLPEFILARFKKKENAEKYIEENKPKYSKSDVRKAFKEIKRKKYNQGYLIPDWISTVELDLLEILNNE